MSSLDNRLRSALDSRRARSILRSLDPVPQWVNSDQMDLAEELTPERKLTSAKGLVDFSSNDYLSLSHSTHLRHSFQEKLLLSDQSPFGPSSSRLLDGNTTLHRTLEKDLSDFFMGQTGLLFNSGFDANVGIWSTIPGPKDWIIYDNLIHASVHDGLRLSRTPSDQRRSFKHNSIISLDIELKKILSNDPALKAGQSSVFISVESLYSMDGDLCPLKDMVGLIEKLFDTHRNAYLVVDEAHSTGLYGSAGRGLVCALSLSEKVLIRLHTFGKSSACSGAIVLAPPLLREYLINYARPLIFSTTMTRMNVMAIAAAISEFKSERRRIAAQDLESLAGYLSQQLLQLLTKYDIKPVDGDLPRPPDVILTVPQTSLDPPQNRIYSPIVPILCKTPWALARFLYRHGLLLRPIGTPTVPAGRELVRICLHANQTKEQIDDLIKLLDHWISIRSPQHHL